jgi:hypothetical protein
LKALCLVLLSGDGFYSQSGQPESSVILSRSAANQLWPNQIPIGRSLRLSTDNQFHRKSDLVPDGPSYQVIGVARDIRGIELDGSDSRQIYVPLPPGRIQDYPILIRTRSDPSRLMDAIGPVIASLDPNLVATTSTLDRCSSNATLSHLHRPIPTSEECPSPPRLSHRRPDLKVALILII